MLVVVWVVWVVGGVGCVVVFFGVFCGGLALLPCVVWCGAGGVGCGCVLLGVAAVAVGCVLGPYLDPK